MIALANRYGAEDVIVVKDYVTHTINVKVTGMSSEHRKALEREYRERKPVTFRVEVIAGD